MVIFTSFSRILLCACYFEVSFATDVGNNKSLACLGIETSMVLLIMYVDNSSHNAVTAAPGIFI